MQFKARKATSVCAYVPMCIVRGLGVLLVGPIIECAGESVDSRRLDEKDGLGS